MSGTQNIQPVPLGQGRAYLWRNIHGVGASAVISAHGGARPDAGARAYYSPNRLSLLRLEFFCEHGENMQDEGLALYVTNQGHPVESILATQSPDYLLSKYTNTTEDASGRHKHNKTGESYKAVRSLVSTARPQLDHYANIAGMSYVAGNKANLDYSLDQAFSTNDRPDVITISGRLGGHGLVRLSELLVWLDEAGMSYRKIGCSFCRGINQSFGRKVQEALFREI